MANRANGFAAALKHSQRGLAKDCSSHRTGLFYRFTHIIALDPQNLASLKKMIPSGGTATVSLLLDEVEGRHGQAVADPYYGDQDGFEMTWADVTSAAQRLARRLLEKS
jgi:protein-tyrosine phosphatase